jgi:hypothetical protein
MSRHLALTLLLVCGQSVAAGTLLGTMSQEDPWIWIIGGFGAAIVYVKNPPTSRADAMVNSLISVMIGGLIAPPVAAYCAYHWDKTLSSPYPFAFVLSSAWPWLMPTIVDRVKTLINGVTKSPPKKPAPKPRRRKSDAVVADEQGEQA